MGTASGRALAGGKFPPVTTRGTALARNTTGGKRNGFDVLPIPIRRGRVLRPLKKLEWNSEGTIA